MLDLAFQFDQQALASQPDRTRYGSGGLPIPMGHVARAVVVTDRRAVKTKETFERRKAEINGYDPGLGRHFETVAESREYRRQNHIAGMTKEEFDSEVGDPSGPMYGDAIARHEARYGKPEPVMVGGRLWTGNEAGLVGSPI